MNYLTILDLHTRGDIHSIQVYMDHQQRQVIFIFRAKKIPQQILINENHTKLFSNNRRIKLERKHMNMLKKIPQYLKLKQHTSKITQGSKGNSLGNLENVLN